MSKMITKLSAAMALLFFTAVSLQAKDISAYYDAPYASAKTVKTKLGKAGFKVLTTYSPANKDYLKVIVFTNKKLQSIASKKHRAFAAVQRVMVDSKTKTVRVTNTEYWLRAFMQKDFKAGSCKDVKASIGKALGKLTATKDVLDSGDIAGYHYAFSMPYYEDMLELKAGKTTVNPKKKLFELKLANGATLVGVKLSSTEKFIETIGEDKALALPYTILIEDGKAYALHAKYYLAVSYPLLTLGQFMKISSTPDAIESKLKKSLK
jgi:hypothetical protein